MGMFDLIDVPDHGFAQVKILEDRRMTTFHVGDLLPTNNRMGESTYSVKLVEFPLWMNVQNHRIVDFTEEPSYDKFDKWGRPYEEDADSPMVEFLKTIVPPEETDGP